MAPSYGNRIHDPSGRRQSPSVGHGEWQPLRWWNWRWWGPWGNVMMRRLEWDRWSIGGEYDATWAYDTTYNIARRALKDECDRGIVSIVSIVDRLDPAGLYWGGMR